MWGSRAALSMLCLLAACGGEAAPAAPPVRVSADDGGGKETAAPSGVRARVARVIDGDTFEAVVGERIVDVRMIGIDAPETVHPTEPVECFGPEASEFTHRRLGNRRVRLESDVQRIDDFGRTLAYVWVGNRLFNEDIVRQGYATVATFPPNVAHVERLVEAERKARRDDLGIWGDCLLPIDTGADWRELSDV